MKTALLFIAASLAAFSTAHSATPTAKSAEARRAEVVFVDPDKFTDVRDSYTATDEGRTGLLNDIREYFEERAEVSLPKGSKLFVSVRDIDLAGEFEPWRSGAWQDVRIVKDIYPPRMKFTFRLTDASGAVVKEGERELSDTAYLMRITAESGNDPLRHDKALIDDWFRQEFKDAKKR